MINLGFTGTRHGMTRAQKLSFMRILLSGYLHPQLKQIVSFHHGDCQGADAEAHDIVRDFCRAPSIMDNIPWIRIIGHPPDDSSQRADKKCDELMPTKPHLQRNHDIVNAADVLIVVPHTAKEVLRSGTWATKRYAEQQIKPVILIKPSGKIEVMHFRRINP